MNFDFCPFHWCLRDNLMVIHLGLEVGRWCQHANLKTFEQKGCVLPGKYIDFGIWEQVFWWFQLVFKRLSLNTLCICFIQDPTFIDMVKGWTRTIVAMIHAMLSFRCYHSNIIRRVEWMSQPNETILSCRWIRLASAYLMVSMSQP